MSMRQAIVWPLTTDQSTFQPYYVCAEANKFPEKLRGELQAHTMDVLMNLIFESEDLLKKIGEFVKYKPAKKSEDDTKYVVDTFVELSDAMAEEIGDNEQLAQWRVRLFQSDAGVVAG